MESKELRLSQNVIIKAVDEKDAKTLIIKGKASVYRTPDGFLQVDRDQELMNLDFMDLDSFRKNPILIVAHQFDRPIGKVTNIEHRDGALEVTAEVHKLTGEENIFEAVQSGILKSFSISVVPHEFVYRDTHDGEILEVARSTLVEVSLMPVQANQEALFEVISSKGVNNVGINKKVLAKQNGMTCDELDGNCAFKAEIKGKSIQLEKEKDMSIVKKEIDAEKAEAAKVAAEEKAADEKAAEEKAEAAKVAADEKAAEEKAEAAKVAADEKAAEEKVKASTDKPFDEAALVAAIELAETEKARLAEEKVEAEKLAADEAKLQEANAAKAKVDTATAYIKEKQQEILDMADEDFDLEKVEEFYELVSNATEAVEEKVLSAISNLQATA